MHFVVEGEHKHRYTGILFLLEPAIKNNRYRAGGKGGGYATLDKAGGSSDIMVNIAASFSVNFMKPYCVYFVNIKRQ